MTTPSDEIDPRLREHMQDFIFSRELAEIYLLLDHISGCSDKSLATALGDGTDASGIAAITEIFEVHWPPEGTRKQRAMEATSLLIAKDKLNFAAKPATGESIAFTIMVAGDKSADKPRVTSDDRKSLKGSPQVDQASINANGKLAKPEIEGVLSRISLAENAYPGLVYSARRFKRWMLGTLILLLVWLSLTCLLSWDVAVGYATLVRV
jgi:hypothetical protein